MSEEPRRDRFPPLQLALAVGLADPHCFDNFHCEPGSEAVEIVRRYALGGASLPAGSRLVFVHGRPGAGKTHLLSAAARCADAAGQRVATIPLAAAGERSPSVLLGLGEADLVCLDDVDAVLGQPAWEARLFHLYNELDAGSGRLLVSAQRAPNRLDARLPDLQSRLCSGVVVRLAALAEPARRVVLQAKANRRGFDLSDEVLDYLLRRARRDMHSLVGFLDGLDRASLEEKRRITVPLVREMLSERVSPGRDRSQE